MKIGPDSSARNPDKDQARTNTAPRIGADQISLDQSNIETGMQSWSVPPSMTLKTILKDPELVKENLRVRGYSHLDVDGLVVLETQRRDLQRDVDSLRQQRNELSKKGSQISTEDRQVARNIGQEISRIETTLRDLGKDIQERFSWFPNFMAPEVPHGSESTGQLVRQWGEIKNLNFQPREHQEVLADLNLIDLERGAKVAGAGFVYMKNELFFMRNALVQLFMAPLVKEGWVATSTPVLANPKTLYGTGFLPWGGEQSFHLADQNLALIGTSEQTLVAQHMDEVLGEGTLPLRYVGDTQCFRREAGASGHATKGLVRLHQFGKVEQIIFCKPEESQDWHEKALENQESLVRALGIPYRVLLMSSGDLAAPGYKKYDLEAWLPGRNEYRELTSNTNLTDFQTRRLNIRYRTEEGNLEFPHTISATGFSDRLLLAIVENYQESNGTVKIPDVLVPLMGGLRELSR